MHKYKNRVYLCKNEVKVFPLHPDEMLLPPVLHAWRHPEWQHARNNCIRAMNINKHSQYEYHICCICSEKLDVIQLSHGVLHEIRIAAVKNIREMLRICALYSTNSIFVDLFTQFCENGKISGNVRGSVLWYYYYYYYYYYLNVLGACPHIWHGQIEIFYLLLCYGCVVRRLHTRHQQIFGKLFRVAGNRVTV